MARKAESETPAASADLKVKTAWLYYVEGLTQEEIAHKLKLHRVKIMRTLAACQAEGLVLTTINAETSEQIALERALEKRWGLSEAMVVPTPADERNLEKSLGHATAMYLDQQMQDGMTLAIGGGATLFASLVYLPRRALKNADVVSLVGSLPHSRWINPSIVASRVAEIFEIESYLITAPVLLDNPALRDALWAQPALAEVRDKIAAADIALLTVGDMSPTSTIFRYGIVPPELAKSLRAKGAVGNLLCQFVDEDGRLVDHDVNRRVMAADLDTVARTPKVVLAAGGKKITAIQAALKAVSVKVMITDVDTAKKLVADDEALRGAAE